MRNLDNYFRVGVITSPHGIAGEVKVYPTTDDKRRFDNLEEVLMVWPRGEQVLHIQHVKYFKNMVILKFKEYNSMNETELLRQRELYVDREHAIPLEEGEYYIADLIGLKVITDEGRELGILDDVLQTGANDVYSVITPDNKEILIPVIDDCILNIDLEKKVITVHVLKGLLED